jgi:hypothetical protein
MYVCMYVCMYSSAGMPQQSITGRYTNTHRTQLRRHSTTLRYLRRRKPRSPDGRNAAPHARHCHRDVITSHHIAARVCFDESKYREMARSSFPFWSWRGSSCSSAPEQTKTKTPGRDEVQKLAGEKFDEAPFNEAPLSAFCWLFTGVETRLLLSLHVARAWALT